MSFLYGVACFITRGSYHMYVETRYLTYKIYLFELILKSAFSEDEKKKIIALPAIKCITFRG